eukprot:COSAG01_NODE_1748_length_9329_cov_99.035861_13_plen_85_part_00
MLGEPKLDSGCGDAKPELQLSSHTATLSESVCRLTRITQQAASGGHEAGCHRSDNHSRSYTSESAVGVMGRGGLPEGRVGARRG